MSSSSAPHAPSIRDSLIGNLERVLGDGVHVIGYQDAADVLDRPTVMVKQTTIQKLEQTPLAAIRIDYVLTFVSPAIDPTLADHDLDRWVPETLDDLRTVRWMAWTIATKRLFGTQLCYDVDAYVLTTPINEPRED